MPEAPLLQWPAQVCPAVGMGGRLPRKVLIRRSAIALGLIILLGLAKLLVSHRVTGPDSLSALPGGRSVVAGLDIGGTLSDYELQTLAASFRVDGVVSLGGPSVAEQVTVTSLHQSYLRLAVPPGAAPTCAQLHTLVNFMHSHASGGNAVYLHDDAGGGRAVATSDMLLLLRGAAWSAVAPGMTPGELQSLSVGQLLAINQLISALQPGHHSSPGNPYADARLDPW